MKYVAYAEDVPADGTCMFHSIALPLKTTGKTLRNLVSSYIEDQSSSDMHGSKISDWIRWETDLDVQTYVNKMRKGMWGGALEMTILSSLLRTPIFVYAVKGNLCVQMTEIRPDTSLPSLGQSVPFICLLYVNSNHYMHLRVAAI